MFYILLLFISWSALSANSLHSQISDLVHSSHEFSASSKEIKQKQEERSIIEGKRLPTLSINGYVGKEREKYSGFDEDYTKKELSFKISQALVDFGYQSNSESMANINVTQGQLTQQILVSNLIFNGIESIINLAKSRLILNYQKDKLVNLGKQIDIIGQAALIGGESVNQQKKIIIEEQQNQVYLENLKYDTISAEITYYQLFKSKPNANLNIPSKPSSYLPKSSQEALDYFIQHAPDYQEKQLSVKAMHHHHQKNQAAAFPTITLTADHTISSNVSQFGQKEKIQSVLVNVDYDLPLSLSTLNKLNSSQASLEKAHEEKLSFVDKKQIEITQAWYKMQAKDQAVLASTAVLKQAKALYDDKISEHKKNNISEIDLLKSEINYKQYVLNHKLETLSQISAQYELLNTISKLDLAMLMDG